MEEKKEQKEQKEQIIFNIENEEDRTKLLKDSESSNYFKPESDTTYKVIVTSPKIEQVIKEFDNDTVVKHQLQIRAQDKDGNIFEGIWEVGTSVLNPIVKSYSPKTVYKITKTGSGKSTRYSVIVDF